MSFIIFQLCTQTLPHPFKSEKNAFSKQIMLLGSIANDLICVVDCKIGIKHYICLSQIVYLKYLTYQTQMLLKVE